MRKVIAVLVMVAFWVTPTTSLTVIEADAAQAIPCETGAEILITQIQAGTSNYRHEFVELHNNHLSEPIDLSDCRLFFSDGSNDLAYVDLAGILPAGSFIWVVHNSYINYLANEDLEIAEPFIVFAEGQSNLNALPSGGGQVYIVDRSEQLVDKVTYGNVPDSQRPAPAPPSGLSIQRCTNDDGFFMKTVNSADFSVTSPPTLSALFTYGPPCQPPNLDCQAVFISEVFANPVGSSQGQQFVEIHNPTDQPRNLSGCGLESSHSSHIHRFSETLQPGEYRAFYDNQTGVRLTISAGGTVYWLSPHNQELQIIDYPAGMTAGTSWSWLGDIWLATYQPTPGDANILATAKPCPAGQERNPETNRCRRVATGSSLTPCLPNQVRNPDTNRCRNINSGSSLTPCRPGQVRNPETNRCRSATTTAALKPCATGQERNPETNRCRKIAGSNGNLDEVEDVEALPVANMINWWLAGGAMAGAMSYGAYEWRQELRKLLANFKKMIGISSGPPDT